MHSSRGSLVSSLAHDLSILLFLLDGKPQELIDRIFAGMDSGDLR